MDTTMISQARAAYAAGAAKPPAVPAGTNMAEIKKAAQAFEAFYLAQALQPMFANVTPSEPFGGGPGEEMWRSMQVQEYGKALAESGGFGLADAVVSEMLKMQEMGANPAP